MKNSKRMIAVIAASGLALGSLPGVANAQSAELGLELGVNLGSADAAVDLGAALGSINPENLPELPEPGTGSLGSLGDATGSAEETPGTPELGTSSLGSLVNDSGSGEGSNGEGSNGDGSGELDSGSLGSLTDSSEPGAGGTAPELFGSLEDIFDSASDEQGGGQQGGSSDSEGADGSSDSEGSNDGDDGLDSGSLTPESGSGSNDEDSTEPTIFDRIAEFFSGIFSGSDDADSGSSSSEGSSGSEDGSSGSGGGTVEPPIDDPDAEAPGSGGEIDAGTLLALGSLAGAGIAIGVAVNGGVNLPPLPGVDVGAVCNLPQEGIDFLKNNGSMEQDECEPEQQPAP